MHSEKKYHSDLSLEQDFIKHVETHHLWKKQDHLYLACSGGIDSVVLAHLMKVAGYRFSLLHCNFQLRGDESTRDALFVQELAKSLGVDIQVKVFDTLQEIEQRKTGVQETARNLRYDWFGEVLDADLAKVDKWLLTAHQSDDQVETMLMNFFRGTGIAGLHGIKVKSGKTIRPLLFVGRAAILAYAQEKQLQWVEDSSNAEINYTRNFLRHQIIPDVEKIFPSLKENLLDNAVRLQEMEMVYAKKIEQVKEKLIQKQGNAFSIPVNKLMHVEPLDTIMHEVFTPFGFTTQQIPEIKKLFNAGSGKFITSKQFRVLRNRNWLLIEPIAITEQKIKVVAQVGEVLTMGDGLLHFKQEAANGKIDTGSDHAYIDLKKIKFPLLVRPWKQGDYFYPLGMKKKKKISRFMTDLKLSLTEKENQWVVESDKKIIWVIGRRIDDRFKIEDETAERLHISITRPS
jgi:tRNA(Ile)-lysidine synthase